jgi:dipeptidase E
MKYYLSSFKIGDEIIKLKDLIPSNNKTAYISNALDMVQDQPWLSDFTRQDINDLTSIGLNVDHFDLRNYFKDNSKLEKDIGKYGVIWVSGGNVFVLRQAMWLSGFDKLLIKLAQWDDLLYGGYSAGICILTPSLRGLELVDSITNKPYGDQVGVIWEGLNLIPYAIVPHFKSNHPESAQIDKVIAFYDKQGTTYKPLKDGEVIVI